MDINVFDSLNITESITPVIVTNRYWVGGTGTWDGSSTTHWSTTSGGSGGASVPTKDTSVIFDANSGGGVVTISATGRAFDLDMQGWTGSITGANTIVTYGWKIRLRNGGSSYWGSTTAIQIQSSNNVTLDPNNSPFSGRINFNQQPLQGVTFVTDLLNDLYGATFLYLYYGELRTNNHGVGAIFFSSNTTGGVKKLTLGSSVVTLSDPANSYYSFFGNGTGTFTLDAGTSTIKISGTFYAEARTFYNVESTGNLRIYNTPTVNDLKLAGGYTATVSSSANIYVNSLTSGGSAGNLASLISSTAGTAFNLRSRINRAYKVYYMSLKDCFVADTTVVWFANKSTDVSGNTNWRFGGDRYWVGGTASWDATAGTKWALTSGGTGGEAVPTYTDDVYFDANSGSNTITIDTADASCNDFKTTGFSGTITGSTNLLSVYGEFLLSPTTTWSFSYSLYIVSGYYSSIKTNGVDLTSTGVYINSAGGKITLDGDLVTKQLTFLRGTFDANDFDISSWGYYSTVTTYARTILMRSGTWNIIGDASLTSGYCWNVQPTNLTITPGDSTINFNTNFTVANSPTFYGGTMTYNNLKFSVLTSFAYIIYSSSSYNNIIMPPGIGGFIYIESGTTQTINNLSIDSHESNVMNNLRGLTSGAPFTLSKTSGVINADFIVLKDSTASGGATFNAINSTDISGNTGWNITAPNFTPYPWETLSISENITIGGIDTLSVNVSDYLNITESASVFKYQYTPLTIVGTGSNAGSGVAWVNPDYITVEDSTSATISGLGTPTNTSQYLIGNNLGFNLSLTAVILGIEVTMSAGANGAITNQVMGITKDGATTVGTTKNTSFPLTIGTLTYGGLLDLWGTTWTPEEINSPNFGATWAIARLATTQSGSGGADFMKVRVYYSEPPTNYSDTINISESVSVVSEDIFINIVDTLNISESKIISAGVAGSINVIDSINISENFVDNVGVLTVNVFDTLNISESKTTTPPFTVTNNRYWVGGSGNWNTTTTNWSYSSGGPGVAPTPSASNDVFFDGNSGGGTISSSTICYCRDLTTTGWVGTIGSGTYLRSNRNIVLSTGCILRFLIDTPSATITVTSNGATILAFNVNGNVSLLDDTIVNDNVYGYGIYVYGGTLTTNGHSVSTNKLAVWNGGTLNCGASTITTGTFTGFAGGAAGTTLNMGSGNIIVSGGDVDLTNLTINPGTSTLTLNGTQKLSVSSTLYNLIVNGTVTLDQSGTFNDIAINADKTLIINDIQTVTVSSLTSNGTAGHLATLKSFPTGFQPGYINKTSGTVLVNYMNIQESQAGGGATWYALNSVDGGGNSGWIFLAGIPSTEDSINISESVSVERLYNVSKVETLNISENILVNCELAGVNKNDTLNIIDIPALSPAVLFPINIYDTLNISENLFISRGITISDSVNISETVSIDNPTLGDINIIDTLNISENIKEELVSYVNKFDLVNISENIFLNQFSFVNKTENINISENISNAGQLGGINKNDTLNISESISKILLLGDINIIDTLNISEFVTTYPITVLEIDSVDTINISENNLLSFGLAKLENINISENIIVAISSLGNIFISDTLNTSENISVFSQLGNINKIENINVLENINIVIPPLSISIYETLNISESISVPSLLLKSIDTSETVNISDIIFTQSTSYIYVSDSINITENVSRILFLGNIEKNDVLYISESLDVRIPELGYLNISDTLNISENFKEEGVLYASVLDSLNIFENINSISSLGNININDFIDVSDNIQIDLSLANIIENEIINISESIVTLNPSLGNINVLDIINISENFVERGQLGDIIVSDSVNISENTQRNLIIADIVKNETINISESNQVTVPSMGDIGIIDIINISENFINKGQLGNIIINDTVGIYEFINTDEISHINEFETINISENTQLESFRFSPSPGNSQPKGSIRKLNPEATAAAGSFTQPVAHKDQQSGREMPGTKRYSL